MRAKRSIQEEKKRKRMEEEGSGGGQEVKQKIKKPRISRVERKRRREEKEELARQVRFAKQQEKIAAQIRKKQEYDLKLQEIRYNEFLFEVEPGTFGLPSMDDDKPTRYRDRRKEADSTQCHHCYKRVAAHIKCSQVFYCEHCISSFYPDKTSCPHCDGTCRCIKCYSHGYCSFGWYLEVIKAHYARPSRGDYGAWLFDLVNALLSSVEASDNVKLIRQPENPFKVLREHIMGEDDDQGGKSKKLVSKVSKYRRLQNSVSCHLCHKAEPVEMMRCDMPKCGLLFCKRLLMSQHGDEYSGVDFSTELFECPRCRKICKCTKCRTNMAKDVLVTDQKTKRQWIFYYLMSIHQCRLDPILYPIVQEQFGTGKLVAKLSTYIIRMFAPPSSSEEPVSSDHESLV